MANQFNEPAWTAEKILEFWENEYGNLEISWRNQFLVNPFVKEMCNHHPVHIRNSILKTIINNDIRLFKSMVNRIKEIKTTAVSNYYNSMCWYYSLTDDEKTLFETVISLSC